MTTVSVGVPECRVTLCCYPQFPTVHSRVTLCCYPTVSHSALLALAGTGGKVRLTTHSLLTPGSVWSWSPTPPDPSWNPSSCPPYLLELLPLLLASSLHHVLTPSDSPIVIVIVNSRHAIISKCLSNASA